MLEEPECPTIFDSPPLPTIIGMVVRGHSPSLEPHHPLPSSPSTATFKFLCSYGGRILPRRPDGRLRYVGGDTRLLSLPRSVSFSELLLKMGELCSSAVSLRCQLPTEDLDALVSITCDEDLANLIDEYDRAAVPKIRVFLFLPKLSKPTSPSSLLASSSSSGGATVCLSSSCVFAKPVATDRCLHQFMDSRPKQPFVSPALCLETAAGKMPNQQLHVYGNYVYGNPGNVYLIHHGNHWQ